MRMNAIVSLIFFVLFTITHLQGVPLQVIIIRHAEKPDAGNELNLTGFERSSALVPFFQGSPPSANTSVPGNPFVSQFGPPTVIISQKPKKSTSSIRPEQTVMPLAHGLGLSIKQPFTRDETAALANLLLTSPKFNGKVVLVSWAHQAITALCADLGASNPPATPEDRFDLIYRITYQNGSPDNPEFCIGLQELMFGDLSTYPPGYPPPCPQ